MSATDKYTQEIVDAAMDRLRERNATVQPKDAEEWTVKPKVSTDRITVNVVNAAMERMRNRA